MSLEGQIVSVPSIMCGVVERRSFRSGSDHVTAGRKRPASKQVRCPAPYSDSKAIAAGSKPEGFVSGYLQLPFASNHHELPWLIELNQFPTQSVNLISHLQIFGLVELRASRSIRISSRMRTHSRMTREAVLITVFRTGCLLNQTLRAGCFIYQPLRSGTRIAKVHALL
jgi:hypothetical protein